MHSKVVRHGDRGAVALQREGPGGDQPGGWPEPMRVFARRERFPAQVIDTVMCQDITVWHA